VVGQELQPNRVEIAGTDLAGFDGGKQCNRPRWAREQEVRGLRVEADRLDGETGRPESLDRRA